jgi:hypothetical protein
MHPRFHYIHAEGWLRLADREIDDLVEFLKNLTDGYQP